MHHEASYRWYGVARICCRSSISGIWCCSLRLPGTTRVAGAVILGLDILENSYAYPALWAVSCLQTRRQKAPKRIAVGNIFSRPIPENPPGRTRKSFHRRERNPAAWEWVCNYFFSVPLQDQFPLRLPEPIRSSDLKYACSWYSNNGTVHQSKIIQNIYQLVNGF